MWWVVGRLRHALAVLESCLPLGPQRPGTANDDRGLCQQITYLQWDASGYSGLLFHLALSRSMKITIKTLQQKVFHVSFCPLLLLCRRCSSILVPDRGRPR